MLHTMERECLENLQVTIYAEAHACPMILLAPENDAVVMATAIIIIIRVLRRHLQQQQ